MQTIEIKSPKKGTKLIDILRGKNVAIETPCGGKGICGKCVCEITANGKTETVLACVTVIESDCTCRVLNQSNAYDTVSKRIDKQYAIKKAEGYAVAFDLGTTTLAFELVDLSSGAVVASYTKTNSQRQYGSDVVSRIQAISEGKLEALHKSITNDMEEGIRAVAGDMPIAKIVVAGNTTMLHLLTGTDCSAMGFAPYTPVFLEMKTVQYKNCEITLLPSISAFVGADIVSGLYYLGDVSQTILLIDIGTNGEMAIVSNGKVLCTSTAAGPAFEGGNIRHGCGGINGAISKYKHDGKEITTIGNAIPVGICGSGVIDIAAELLRHGIIDETGYMEDDIYLTPEICFTQQDVRELQLAKSAIRAGLETLINESGLTYDGIEAVYLAGGFGYHIDIENAVEIGMIPKELRHKVIPAGNTSLAGCVKYLLSDEEIPENTLEAAEISLSDHVLFNELYMEHMMF
jgi:uncharacterized 2Fe-2S/4Fe-4S cluster protein (DUF4445 family)